VVHPVTAIVGDRKAPKMLETVVKFDQHSKHLFLVETTRNKASGPHLPQPAVLIVLTCIEPIDLLKIAT
jgi:hypothetical protein